MKYWQEERWQKATKQNIPNLYLYTWIRASAFFFLMINSLLMIFLLEAGSALDNQIQEETSLFVFLAIFNLICIIPAFDERMVNRKLFRVVSDCLYVLCLSCYYLSGSKWILVIYVAELIFIIYFGIKIHKDNSIVDDCEIVIWWKQKKRQWSQAYISDMLSPLKSY